MPSSANIRPCRLRVLVEHREVHDPGEGERLVVGQVQARGALLANAVQGRVGGAVGAGHEEPEHALQLAKLARDCAAFVNLIPLHPGGGQGFAPTPRDEIVDFAREIRKAGVEVAIRKSRGIDIAAACGQLRAERVPRRSAEKVGA
ncbi:MAG: hypothetical protein HYX65_05090 [Gemmatimonadetes bacterium]|nr:hypothetical protein [Gemmatimonadota bacterium]